MQRVNLKRESVSKHISRGGFTPPAGAHGALASDDRTLGKPDRRL